MSVKSELGALIDHVVIIVKENHTFDNYFGTFPGAEGVKLGKAQIVFDTPYVSNLPKSGVRKSCPAGLSHW